VLVAVANIKLENINKFFSDVHALKDLSLEVSDKQFLVIVGPSGSGKTTLLRILAGLESPSSGDVFIDDQKVTNVPTADRDIAMVFQSYSLYPHLSVRDNLALALQNRAFTEEEKDIYYITKCLQYCFLASLLVLFSLPIYYFLSGWFRLSSLILLWLFSFGILSSSRIRSKIEKRFLSLVGKYSGTLRSRLTKEQEIMERIRSTTELLGIQTLLKRKPNQLSGGERQRVALGRAIIRKPKVFLMDEPLSNLDAKLRGIMRAEIAELQRKLQITTVYVTHDQTEAMTLGQRIVILNGGRIEQNGSPREVYSEPSNVFVASFIGNPPMNLIQGKLKANDGGQQVVFAYDDNQAIVFPENTTSMRISAHLEEDVVLGIRPEHLTVLRDSKSKHSDKKMLRGLIKGIVVHVESLGSITLVHLKIGKQTRIVVSVEGYSQFDIGDQLSVEIPSDNVRFFNAKSGLRI